MRFIFSLILILSFLPTTRAIDSAARPSRFEQAYSNWKGDIATNLDLRMRPGTPQYSCDSFKALVNLGMEILPEVVAKLSIDPTLAPAVYQISKKEFPREDFRRLRTPEDAVRYYQTWWRTAEADTEASFTEEFGKRKDAKRQKLQSEEKARIDRVKGLGRLALPRIFAKIAEGETDLVPVASELVGGALPSTATPAQCAGWWQQNKTKWSVPPRAGQIKTKESP